jgi:hypothetical protein
MKTTTKNTGIKVTTSIKAGGIGDHNHSRGGLKVKSGVRAAGICDRNHSRIGLKVSAGIRAGSLITVQNHNSRILVIA